MSCRTPLAPALALVAASVLASVARAEPDGPTVREVSFGRHVAPLLSKFGCSAGACHGSFQGKGGLTLSLFGQSPEKDYFALTRSAMGRRVNVADPDASLLLLKPTAQIPHEGGKRLDRGSWAYRVLRAWIAQGAKGDVGPPVRRLSVTPRELVLKAAGESAALAVVAEFDDGARADVTAFCDYRVKDDAVAEVTPLGRVRALRPGDAAVVVAYRGQVASARVLVPAPSPPGFSYPEVSEVNFIDREVFAKLRRLNVAPSNVSGDEEFLRRVTLDAVACLPSPQEVRAFLADRNPDKRAHKIDELLRHPLHAALWATKLCDLTACNVDVMDGPADLRAKRAKMWHDWFRDRIAENVPYDRIVHGVLCAASRDGRDVEAWVRHEAALAAAAAKGFDSDYAARPSLDLFWRRGGGDEFFPLEQMGELTASAFLGVRLECAQCHRHPFDRWTQSDYRAFANVFAQVQYGSSPEVTAAVADLLEKRRALPPGAARPPLPRVQEVYLSDLPRRRLPHPETDADLPPRALGGPELDYRGDAREQLFRWLVRADNPFFARAFVNRVWAHYFGAGLVEPIDNLSAANPPSNERLLDAMARDFVAHRFDLRRLERIILLSRTYQLSSTPNESNRGERTNFSHASVRRLPAEAVVDLLNSALGAEEDFSPDAPPGAHAIEVATNRARSPHLARVFRVFGRPPRTTTCDCERSKDPAIPQTLFVMTDPGLLKKIEEGRLKKLLADKKTDEEVVEELFLATLTRPPDDAERRDALAHVRGGKDRQAGFVDLVWALINTREFILNH
jgi:hypothetical protein